MSPVVLVIAAAGVIGAASVSGGPARAATGHVVNVTATPDLAEGEEFIAPNPRNPRDILLGSNQFQPATTENAGNVSVGPSGVLNCGLWASHDGGATWSGGRIGQAGIGPVQVPPVGLPGATLPTEFHDVGNLISADQNIVWDRQGNAYYQCIYSGATTNDIKVLVYRSADAGRTWSTPVEAFSEVGTAIQIDRTFLAIDNSGGPRDGTVYLAFETMFYQPLLSRVYVRRSSDGGRTWGGITRADDDAHPAQWDPREFPQVSPDGTLRIVYDSSTLTTPSTPQLGTPISLVLASSHDGGATFTQSVIAQDIVHGGSPDEAFNYFQEMIAAFAVDPSDPRRMVLAWPEGSSGVSRLAVRSSADGGATWNPVQTAAALAASGAQDHPALAVLPDGRAALMWKDRACCGGSFNSNFEVLMSLGTWSGGRLTLSPAVRLTDTPQPPTTGHHGTMPTEYISIAADTIGVDATWEQLSGALTDNVFRHLEVAPLSSAVSPPAAVSGTSGPAQGTPSTGAARAGSAYALVVLGLAAAVARRRAWHRHDVGTPTERDDR